MKRRKPVFLIFLVFLALQCQNGTDGAPNDYPETTPENPETEEILLSGNEDSCPDDMFECADKLKCIPLKWKCDFSPDCLDGSDEPPDCPEAACNANQFMCKHSKKCIPAE